MNSNRYERKEIYTLEEVFSKIQKGRVDFDGDLIKMSSARYYLFKNKGVVCVECKLAGTFFVKEKCKSQEASGWLKYFTPLEQIKLIATVAYWRLFNKLRLIFFMDRCVIGDMAVPVAWRFATTYSKKEIIETLSFQHWV